MNGSSAQVAVTGGALYVTNAGGTAVTTLNGGSLRQGAGVFKTDNLILTNGGSVLTISNYVVGSTAGTTNTVTITGGTLIVTNAALGIGNDGTTTNGAGIGSATFSNAIVAATTLNIGSTAGGLGSLVVQSNAT